MGKPFSDYEGEVDNSWETDGEFVRQAYTLREDDDDFSQPGALIRDVMGEDEVTRLVETVATALQDGVPPEVQERAFWYWKSIDQTTGERIEQMVREGQEGAGPVG